MWTDFWLPRPSTFRVLTSPPYHSANTRVSSLVNLDSGDWNVHVINQLFLPTDVISILSIPLSHHKPRDELVWAYTPRGNFTVNNAYKVAISMARCNPVAETSHGALHTSFWRKIWNLHTPSKIELFTWRACQDILPTKANLCHRHILDSPAWETCNVEPETVEHLLWDCSFTKKVWSTSNIPFDSNGLSFMHFKDFLLHLIFKQHMCSELLELIVTTAWSIWFNRNKTRLGNACQSPHEIIHKARVLLLEYQHAHLRPPLFKNDSDTRWVPPVFPWYKVNVDAVVFSNLGTTRIGVIIRDHEGSVIAAMSKRLPLSLGPLEAEAKAMDEAVLFAWEVRIRDIIFETDSCIAWHAL